MDKELYTFTTDYDNITNIFQIEAESHFDALQKWIDKILTKSYFKDITRKILAQQIEKIECEEVCKNVLYFEIEYDNDLPNIYVHFVLTSQKDELFYDTDIAPKFIHKRSEDIDKKIINLSDIEFILTLAIDFLEESGSVKGLKCGKKTYYQSTENEDEIEKTKYIQIEALKTGKNYPTDLIDEVLDLEFEYMESIGLYQDDQTVKYLGIEFKKTIEN